MATSEFQRLLSRVVERVKTKVVPFHVVVHFLTTQELLVADEAYDGSPEDSEDEQPSSPIHEPTRESPPAVRVCTLATQISRRYQS